MPGRLGRAPQLPRLVVSADFERVLRLRSRAATAHFAVHHLAAVPSRPSGAVTGTPARKLSTEQTPASALPVEDFPADALPPTLSWVGAVVPKRHARRAVTRSLIKRQIYAAVERHRHRMAPGLWIVRLRSPFDRAEFKSAASRALLVRARAELDHLLGAVVAPAAP